MAKIIVKQSPYRFEIPGQIGHLLKIWSGEKEPPKNYLWDVEGNLFVWFDNDWIFLEDYIERMELNELAKEIKKLSLLDIFEMKYDS